MISKTQINDYNETELVRNVHKVADFGLAKLVGRTNDDDFIATRLVGTPGYLPPE